MISDIFRKYQNIATPTYETLHIIVYSLNGLLHDRFIHSEYSVPVDRIDIED